MPDQNTLLSTPRIRCNYCNRRIPASSVVCPNCQRNPRAFYWKRRHVLYLLAVLLLALAGAAFFLLPEFRQLAPTGVAPNPTATRTNTRPAATLVPAATRPPATATSLPPTPTRPNTATPRPTDAPTFTPTATRTRNPASNLPEPTETPSPIPTVIPVKPPQLVSPADGTRISGGNKRVDLTFQPAQPLGSREWYRVQVDFLDRGGNPISWCGFTREDSQEFPREFYDDSSPNVRSFLWRVSVVSSNQFNPTTCDAPYEILSAPSEAWTFNWY